MTGEVEHDEPDFTPTKMGIPVIPANAHDFRNEGTSPVGSADFAILPGVADGEVLGSPPVRMM